MSSDLNLLPPERKQVLAQSRLLLNANRFVLSVLMGLVLISVVGGVSVLVLHGLLTIAVDSAADDLARTKQEYDTVLQSVNQENIVLTKMTELQQAHVQWIPTVAELVSTIPAGVTVTTMQGQTDPEKTISFSGIASTRNALIIAGQRISLLPWVGSVTAPDSNLIDRVNAPYEFRITIK